MLESVTVGASVAGAASTSTSEAGTEGAASAAGTSTVSKNDSNEFSIFGDIMRKYFLENKEKIRQRVLQGEMKEYTIGVYKMTVLTDYKGLLEKFN